MRAELERLGALREEAQAAEGSLRKVNVDPGSLRQASARASPSLSPLVSPLELAGADTLPRSPRRHSGREAGAHFSAVSSPPNPPRAAVADPNPL